MSQILVVGELQDGKLRKATLSAVTAARELSAGGAFSILLVGAGAKNAASEAASFGASKVLVAEDASVKGPVSEQVAPTVVALAKAGGFNAVVMTATSFGKDLAPRVAARLEAAYAADISGIQKRGAGVVYKRPIYAGNAYAFTELKTPVHVVSVRQSEFTAAEPSGGASPIEDAAFAPPGSAAQRIEFVALETTKSERPDLGDARVVVSGGRALKEKFSDVLEPLASHLGAALGASRAACDAGYAPAELQVGQTGRVVAPQLYLAIGISGAIQHLAGMKGSKTIVAINKDPEAPIFQVADYGLVADLFTAVPELLQELKKQSA